MYPEAVALRQLGEGMLLHAVALADEALDAVALIGTLEVLLCYDDEDSSPRTLALEGRPDVQDDTQRVGDEG